MARLELPPEGDRTAEQSAVCAEASAGRRGHVPAPVAAWIRNPELARRAQRLGELIRYETTLTPCQSELAILVTARHWTSHMEWTAHKQEALKAGLDPEIIRAIAEHRSPALHNAAERMVYDVAVSLLTTQLVPDALYHDAITVLGERGLVELIAILGYYGFVSMTLNTFEIGLPEAYASELTTLMTARPDS